ncbi:MAG: DNA translocase FtsK, partial [Ktedonobacteraceae bacterium]
MLNFNTDAKVAEKQAQIQKLQAELAGQQSQAQSLFQHGRKYAQQIESYFHALLDRNQQTILATFANRPPQSVDGWNREEKWIKWDASQAGEEPLIRIGDMVEQEASRIEVSASIPFVGANRTVIIRGTGTNALGLLQSLAIRTAFMLPHQSKYTLLDPAGNGIAFPMRRYLPQVRENSSDIRRDLDQVLADIQRVIETYLDATTTSFELVPRDIRVNERFQFVFAADFPNQYDRRAIEALQSIGNTGAAAGVYLFIQQNLGVELPHDMSMSGFKNAFYIDLTTPITSTQGLRFLPDEAPTPQMQSKIFEILRLSKPEERKLDWENIVSRPESQWWRDSTAQSVETPIGLRSGGESMNIWFGVKNDQPCAHGML